jgi:medium-chain acyl-[acyl-carrier-protein] hydrolase
VSSNGWFFRPKPVPHARLRLFCFPYAGAGASVFRTWPSGLPADVEVLAVQPPGRESRFQERPLTDLAALVDALTPAVRGYLSGPYAFFGHSLGATVAFELARRLARGGQRPPVYLFVSGRRGPRLPNPDPPIRHLPDAEFIDELKDRYGGVPDEVLQHAELLQLLLPILRADITMFETYEYREADPLRCPLAAFGGTEDPRSARPQIGAWREETAGPFSAAMFPGGHFFIDSARGELLATVSRHLTMPAPDPAGVPWQA